MMKGGNSSSIKNSCNANSNSSGSKYVSELRASDVLFGRGSGPNDHIGNIRFRQYVAERKAQYMSTNHRLTKTKIAREIVNLVWQEHGRFVKKVEPQELQQLGLPENTEYYELVDDDTIMEKAKQALRQNQNSASAAAAASTGAATMGVTSSSVISQGGSSNHSSIATNSCVDMSSSLSSSNSTSQPTQHPSVVTSSGTTSTNTPTTMMSSEDISYHSYDLEPLPLMATSESQIPMENMNHNNLIGSRRNSSNHHINSSDIHHSSTNPNTRDVMRVPEDWTNTAIHGGGGFHNGYGNVTTTATATSTTAIPHPNNMMLTNSNTSNNYMQTNNQDYQHLHQQRQRLQQLQEQQRLLHHQQQQLQLQMAAIMDDTTPLPLHHPQQQQRTMLSLEQHALLRSRQQQQHEQEQQLAAAIRSLDVYPIIQNTSNTTTTTIASTTNTNSTASGMGGTRNNNNHVLDDHSHFNSSMAQLPHEEVSYSTKRHSIRIEDLEHVRATVASAMSARGGCVDDIDDDDEDESSRPVGKNINMAANNQHLPSMNSINNFSMSLQQIQRGSVDELMGSFHQMKTPSMEVNLENSVYLSSFAATDPNSSHNRNKNSSSSMLTQEQHRSKMMASTETMGTIELIGSTADMSILMGSSTFSLFRHGNESSAIMEESGTTGTTTSTSGATAGSLMQRGGGSSQLPLHRQNSINQSQFLNSLLTQPSMASKSSSKTSSSIESNNSFHLSEIFGKSSTNVVNNNSMSMAYVMSDVRRQIDEENTNDLDIHDNSNYIYDESGVVATLPRTIGVMLELPDETNSTSNQNSCTDNLDMMGSSSLAVLQGALLHSTNTEIQGDDDDDEVNHRHRRNEHDTTTTTTKSP